MRRQAWALLLALLMAASSAMAQEHRTEETVHESERYLSVVTTVVTPGGNGDVEIISARTSARDGLYAGQALTLSQLLGLEQEEGRSVAAELAYALVWQQIEAQSEIYLEGLVPADLRLAFQPETDYYLDRDGNVVLFIQQGEIAGEVAGILRFPFAMAELMSALAE